MRARSRPEQALVFVPAAVALGVLLLRLARDVHGKPLIEDEAVSGLISARPLHELLATVLTDRGGAPLHFVLAHIVLVFDSLVDVFCWLSIVLVVGVVLVSFELGRRLGGRVAGATAPGAGASAGVCVARCGRLGARRGGGPGGGGGGRAAPPGAAGGALAPPAGGRPGGAGVARPVFPLWAGSGFEPRGGGRPAVAALATL